MSEVGRNDQCPCGSGKKYKKCCLSKDAEACSQQNSELDAWLDADFALGQQRVAEADAQLQTV